MVCLKLDWAWPAMTSKEAKFKIYTFLYDIAAGWIFQVRPHLRQVFSYFGVIAPGTAELWASTGAIWQDMLLAEALDLYSRVLIV